MAAVHKYFLLFADRAARIRKLALVAIYTHYTWFESSVATLKWPPPCNVSVCAYYVPTCLPPQVSVVLQCGFQGGSESMRSLSSASLGASMLPANVPHLCHGVLYGARRFVAHNCV